MLVPCSAAVSGAAIPETTMHGRCEYCSWLSIMVHRLLFTVPRMWVCDSNIITFPSRLSTFISSIICDSKPPCEQSKLSKIQLQEKEFSVFNKAISELKGYWKDAKFDSYPAVIDTVKCGEDELRWNDYVRVKTFFKSPLMDLHNFGDLSNECKKNVSPCRSSQ